MSLTPAGLPLKSVYKTLDGKIVAWGEVIWENGKFKEYRYQRDPIQEKGRVTLNNDSFHFFHTMDGKTSEKKEEYGENFISGPLTILYIQSHWDQLIQGEEKVIRYGVIDQLSSFEFGLIYDPSHPQNRPDRVVFKMNAKNFFIRFFVDPIYLVYEKESGAFSDLPVLEDPEGLS